ncbi:MAG TPA: PAS domain S-box protein [Isosphaeraceae bacterium]
MSQTAALADHIDERTDAIIAVWRAAVERKGDVPDSHRLSYAEFVDHVPEILERIADRLRGEPRSVDDAGRKHGSVRWKQGYDVAEVVCELGHLRAALLQATFAHARELGFEIEAVERASGAINAVLDEAAAEAVQRFQQESQAKAREILAEIERRRVAVDSERGKLQTVLNNLPVGVWVINAEGAVIALNRVAERLQGFPASETVGRVNLHDHRPHSGVAAPDGRPLASEELPGLRALGGEDVTQQEMLWRVGDEERSILANASPLHDSAGAIAGAVIVAQDVTERTRLRAELARSESRFRAIAEQMPVLIWRSDTSGRCDYFNPAWLDFRGRTLAQESGDGWAEGVHPDDYDRCLSTYLEAFGAREPFEMTYRLLRRDGVYRWISDHGAPHFDEQGGFLGYLGSCVDITERVEFEESLERQSEHKSRLMAALSHDARTPLNAVFLAAQLLETQVKDEDDPEVQESLRVIRDSVRNLLDLLSDLLDLTRIDAGATPAEVSKFALEPTLAECLSSIEPQARAKGLDLRFEPDGLDGLHLATDRNKLKQILANFLSNALRYTERGHIRLYGHRDGDRMRISVEDTGVGIAPEDHGKVFDEFATLGQGRRETGGTGLGLAICRRLAALLGGEIVLESAPGRGSTFTLSLPASILVDKPTDHDLPTLSITPASGPILVAEDHEPSRRALARVLRGLGYRVLEAEDGRAAVELARGERPFVVLMDVNMPGMDGIEAVRTLRSDPRTRDLPIFALTGDVTVVNRRRIGEAGVDGYLEKPVSWEQIEQALARVSDRLPKAP